MAGRGVLQATSMINDANGVFERQNPRAKGRRHFADTVPDDSSWLDTPRLPQLHQRNLESTNCRLCDGRLVDIGLIFSLFHLRNNRPAAEFLKQCVYFLDRAAKQRFALQQLLPHPPPLTALSREDEDKFFCSIATLTSENTGG